VRPKAAWKAENESWEVRFWQRRGQEIEVNVEKISAVTLAVASMRNSVRFYRDILGIR
jgi:hypothetical protein